MENLYEILQISQKASKEIIEKAYRVLAKKYHPDLQEPDNRAKAEEMMKKINYAYDVLCDDTKRAEYDERLREVEQEEKEQNNQYQNIDYENNEDGNHNYEVNNSWQEYYNNLTGREQRRVRKKIERSVQAEYRKLYEDYFRSKGYKVKHKWTWKEIKILLIVLLSIEVSICNNNFCSFLSKT